MASDHGVWKERRSIDSTAGRSLYTRRLMRISFKPKLRVGWSQVDRFDRLGPCRAPALGEQADVPGRDPVRSIRVRQDLGTRSLQLTPKSYRPRSGRQRPPVQRLHASRELVRGRYRRLPDLLATGPVQRRERLAAASVQNRQRGGVAGPCPALDPARERREGSHRHDRLGQRLGQRPRGRNADPQAGERARADAHRDRVDSAPPPGALRSEEHTSELQSLAYLVCRLLLEKKKKKLTRFVCHKRQMAKNVALKE